MNKFAKHLEWIWTEGTGALVLVLALLIVALVALWGAAELDPDHAMLAGALRVLASLLVGSGVGGLFARSWFWRDAMETLTPRIRGAEAATDAGLSAFSYYGDAPQLASAFVDAREVALVGATLADITSGQVRAKLEAFLRQPNTRLTVVLSDPDDAALCARLDAEFPSTKGPRADRIRGQLALFEHIREACGAGDSPRVALRVTHRFPRYTGYRFDQTWMVTPYLYRRAQDPGAIPIATFRRASPVGQTLDADLAWLLTDEGSRPWTP